MRKGQRRNKRGEKGFAPWELGRHDGRHQAIADGLWSRCRQVVDYGNCGPRPIPYSTGFRSPILIPLYCSN